jgi:hypothetical protein
MQDESTKADRIRRRAYELWERDGSVHGRALDHWLQAEREIAEEDAGSKASQAVALDKQRARADASPGKRSARNKAAGPSRTRKQPQSLAKKSR